MQIINPARKGWWYRYLTADEETFVNLAVLLEDPVMQGSSYRTMDCNGGKNWVRNKVFRIIEKEKRFSLLSSTTAYWEHIYLRIAVGLNQKCSQVRNNGIEGKEANNAIETWGNRQVLP